MKAKVLILVLFVMLFTACSGSSGGGGASGANENDPYTVTFNVDGVESSLTVPKDTSLDAGMPSEPSKAGYIFSGWNSDVDATVGNFTSSTIVTEDITVYAIWKAVDTSKYAVTFVVDNVTYDVVQVNKNSSIVEANMPSNPAKYGYVFIGWNTDKDSTIGNFTSSTTVTAHTTVHAIWKSITFDVVFIVDGTTLKTLHVIKHSSTGAENMPSDPTKAGYVFAGWNTDKNATTGNFTSSTIVTADTTVHAIWNAVNATKYTVKFMNEGAEHTTRIVVKDGTVGEANMPVLVSETHRFVGWNTNNTATTSNFFGSTKVVDDIVVYAIWEPKVVVSFYVNGALYKTVRIDKNTSIDGLLPQQPSKIGYKFVGWNTDESATSGNLSGQIAADITVYAIWKQLIKRTVNFYSNGIIVDTANVYEGNTIGADMPDNPTKSGYKFIGWNTTDNSTVANFDKNTKVVVDTSVYAVWGLDLWAQTAKSDNDHGTSFLGTTTDADGNMYVVGYQNGTNEYQYGLTDATKAKGSASWENSVLIKYDNNGKALWARSVSADSSFTYSQFNAVTTDSDGNVYAVGTQNGLGVLKYSETVTAKGVAGGNNAVIVKYNSSGEAQWAKTIVSGNEATYFNSVAVDDQNSIFVVGTIKGNDEFNFGTYALTTVTGSSSGENAVLVKYTSAGFAVFAKTPKSVTGTPSKFNGVTATSSGIYVVGYQEHDSVFKYGADNNTNATVSGTGFSNSVLVKYDNTGSAIWAKTSTHTGKNDATNEFSAVTSDAAGNIYAAGNLSGGSEFQYGTTDATKVTGGYKFGENAVVVKYDENGSAVWAKSVNKSSVDSGFTAITTDVEGNVYVAGYKSGNMLVQYGTVNVYGPDPDCNSVVAKYTGSGEVQWAKTLISGNGSTSFSGITTDKNYGVYAVGSQYGEGEWQYGDSSDTEIKGGVLENVTAVFVKYKK